MQIKLSTILNEVQNYIPVKVVGMDRISGLSGIRQDIKFSMQLFISGQLDNRYRRPSTKPEYPANLISGHPVQIVYHDNEPCLFRASNKEFFF